MDYYEYIECGLDGIRLLSGFDITLDPAYGECVTIHNVDGLQKAIGRWVVEAPRTLNGRELRYLRGDMELAIEELSALSGVRSGTLRRFERGRTVRIDPTFDRVMRLLWLEYAGDKRGTRTILEALATPLRADASSATFEYGDGAWKLAGSV